MKIVSQNNAEGQQPSSENVKNDNEENQSEEVNGEEEKKKKKKRHRVNKGAKSGKGQTDPPSLPITELFPDGKNVNLTLRILLDKF